MRHNRTVKKLGRTAAHRNAMLANMAMSLFRSHAITTTRARARVLRSVAERLITLGKKGDIHARRIASRRVRDRVILKKLFDEIAPQFSARNGGYTRIIKIGQRKGDGADLARVELLIPKAVVRTDETEKKAAKGKAKGKEDAAAAEAKGKKSKKAAAAAE
jgi:large subunit ribosomal protein L17